MQFLKLYPRSERTPGVLLLLGDLAEEATVKLSKSANSKLKKPEMAATRAPLHSYFLNFVELDRYRRLGISYVFNPQTRQYHYNGDCWQELVRKFPNASEKSQALARLDTLKRSMPAIAAAAAGSK